MLPNNEIIADIGRNVWESMLGFAILEVANDRSAEPAPHLWWAVDINGDWKGTVLLCVPEEMARNAAAVTFNETAEAVTVADAVDVVAELTNMIGGNIKGTIAGTHKLSLPRPATQTEIASATKAKKLWFSCPGGEFALTVAPRSQP